MKALRNLFLIGLIALLPLQSMAQKKKKGKDTPAAETTKPAKKNGMKSYEEIITKDAKSDDGLFTVHKLDDKYYFELPNSILEKEILIVSRISGHVKGLNFGGAGMKSRPQQVIRFQRLDNQILMRSVSYNSVAEENTPIYTSVKNNNFEPIISTFKVETISKDSSSVVFDVTSLFTEDVDMIGALSSRERTNFKIKGLDKSRSLITSMKSYPENVIINHILTYRGDQLPDNDITGTLSIGMTQSMILLPTKPMVPRYYDERVGYFSLQQLDYGADEQKAATRRFITKWNLEPKDWDAYNRGELVEPIKPIVYYIDPATPTKWAKYIKQGVDDWQTAFEKAGFKNAIQGKYAPTKEEDPDWSPEDVRYSVIRYIATDIQNAQGPHVHDPRTGEILESDILWYHNVMNLLRNWYFIQTAAVNPDARKIKFDDELMGQLIRFVAAHEVGHTLGLPHNMGSSVAYPVDSLRSPSFTATHGTAPSIMDYARFNYVAQPGDDTCFMPAIGPYDQFAIEWGYRPMPGYNELTEREGLREMVVTQTADPVYRFSSPTGADPTALTEAIGDDAMRASDLGIENLKRIVDNLKTWTYQAGEDFSVLEELYTNVIGQWNRYSGHVLTNIGGVVLTRKHQGQEGVQYERVPKESQERAMDYLNNQVFATPTWMLRSDILDQFQDSGAPDIVRQRQVGTLNQVLNTDRMKRLIEQEAFHGSAAYSLSEMMTDLRNGVWSELSSGNEADLYRRNLQRAYLGRMDELMNDEEALQTDVAPYVRAHLNSLLEGLLQDRQARNGASLNATALHYDDSMARIQAILEPNG